jgi:arylsulfatase
VPWNVAARGGDFLNAPWELYHVEDDFSEADDLATKNPEKLKELQALFEEEAKKYNVFPLDPRFSERGDPRNRATGEPPTSWIYYGTNTAYPRPLGQTSTRTRTRSRPN